MRHLILAVALLAACRTDKDETPGDTDAGEVLVEGDTDFQQGERPALTGPPKGSFTATPNGLPDMEPAEAIEGVTSTPPAVDPTPVSTPRAAPEAVTPLGSYLRLRVLLRNGTVAGQALVRLPGTLAPQARVQGRLAAVVRDTSDDVRWVTTAYDARRHAAYVEGQPTVSTETTGDGWVWLELPGPLVPVESSVEPDVRVDVHELAPTVPSDLPVDADHLDDLLAGATLLGTVDRTALWVLNGGKP